MSNHPLWRLIRQIGSDVIQIVSASDIGDVTLGTNDQEAAIDALLKVCSNPEADRQLRLQAAIILGTDGELAPLQLVLPKLASAITNRETWVAEILEVAAPAPGNENLFKPPSAPTKSLRRLAALRPDLRETVEEILF